MKVEKILLPLGPLLFFGTLLLPLPLSLEQKSLAGVMMLTISWWLSPGIPLAVTGLVAVCLAALTGATTFQDALVGFNNPVIFLFLGGFFMAQAIHQHELDVWIAKKGLSSSLVKGDSRRIFLMTAVLTALFSAVLSNTATTAMFMPIGLSLLHHLKVKMDHPSSSILLLIPYAATIGGVLTPIGTPPNVLALSLLDRLVNIQIPFLSWMVLMLPVTLIMLGGLVLVFLPELRSLPKGSDHELSPPPPLTPSQSRVLGVVFLAMTLWVLPGLMSLLLGKGHELSRLLTARLPEGLVGIFAGSLLFFIPDGKKSVLLTWKDAEKIDWGTLILFGAGISLGEIVFKSGLAQVIGNALPFAAIPLALGILLMTFLTVFGSEFVSNTAIANLLIPLTVATVPFKDDPLVPVLAVTLASSLAFMMPVGTPPNAIAYGTGLIRLKDMLRKGFLLNLISITTIWLLSLFYF